MGDFRKQRYHIYVNAITVLLFCFIVTVVNLLLCQIYKLNFIISEEMCVHVGFSSICGFQHWGSWNPLQLMETTVFERVNACTERRPGGGDPVQRNQPLHFLSIPTCSVPHGAVIARL